MGFNPSNGNSLGQLNGYITQAPICITYNDGYDVNSLDDFVNGRLVAALDDSDVLDITSMTSGANGMNFTIQISHASGGVELTEVLWDGTKEGNLRDDTLCDDFESVYSQFGATCDNCMDVITFALFDESGADAKSGYLGICVGFILALFVYV